jgi:hypothetical protein
MLVAALHMDPEEVRGPRHLEHLQAAMRHEGKEVGLASAAARSADRPETRAHAKHRSMQDVLGH